MIKVRKNNLLVLVILICVISLFAVSYNVSVNTVVANLSSENSQLLETRALQIIRELASAESVDRWNEILVKYEDFDITVENGDGKAVAENHTSIVISEGITQRRYFDYKGEKYALICSVHLLNNFSEHMSSLLNFIVIELIIGILIVLATITVMYFFIIRPYKAFYDSIEEYEKSGRIIKRKFRGYVGKVYNRFFALTKNLDENEKKQRRIIASISHDIKTPLTSIMGYTERLSKDNISEKRKEQYIETIYTKATEIRRLVDEFDEFLDYGISAHTEKEKISLFSLFETLKNEYEDELSSYSVSTEFFLEENGEEIFADRKKLSRVFGNIVGNSVKHFKKEENKKIRFTVSAVKKEAIITIADNGSGVKEESLEVIFEPFYTSDKGRKVAGLGLSICREIIENHGGQIYAQNSAMGGLEIIIRLPLYSQFD